jgi:isopenicillin N synthase-like dioxygenase
MSSTTTFGSITVPTDKLATLQTISLYELQNRSVLEQNRLLQACINDGFFYLDLTHPTFTSLMGDIEAVFDLSKDVFNYPIDIKTLFDVDTISDLKTNGYKPKGRNVVAKDGKGDGFESWVVSLRILLLNLNLQRLLTRSLPATP